MHDRLLTPGTTCWRLEASDNFAHIVDAADYFLHCKAAMTRAQHRIMLIGWDFDTRMTFERGRKTTRGPNQLGTFLRWLVRVKPELEVYVLRSNLRMVPAFQAIWGQVTPVALLNWLSSDRLHFAIDGAHPTGSVHHQKIAVIDDAVAFCGGIDLSVDRWDTPDHVDRSRLRQTQGRRYGPRHDVTTAVDGAAARALGELARYRWEWATAQSLPPLEATHAVWPPDLQPSLRDVEVAVVRTFPELNQRNEIREVEALNLAAIAAARSIIYLENQYLASRAIADALSARLQEDDGPEVVIVMPRTSESLLEQQAMDSARHRLLKRLWDADQHGRLGVYWPETDGGTPVYVHSKVLVVDDRLLRIGSSNLNNRSMGFDSECDVAIEAGPDATDRSDIGRLIATVRVELLSEHLGVSAGVVRDAARRHGSFVRAIEVLRGKGRTLRPFTARTVAGEASLLAENDLMDPDHVPKSVTRSVQRWINGFAE